MSMAGHFVIGFFGAGLFMGTILLLITFASGEFDRTSIRKDWRQDPFVVTVALLAVWICSIVLWPLLLYARLRQRRIHDA